MCVCVCVCVYGAGERTVVQHLVCTSSNNVPFLSLHVNGCVFLCLHKFLTDLNSKHVF